MKKNLKLKGYVTIVVLILMSVLVAVSYLYADALFSELAIARNNKGSTVAFALAEAGVQEAIYKVRYDPGIKAHFLTGSGSDILPLKPALINNGSYKVTLIYTNPATATIESTGFYQMGLRTAQRRITENIDQATLPLIWDIGAAIFTSPGSAPNNLTNIDLKNAKTIRIYNGGIFSGLDLNTKNVTNIAAEGRIRSMGIIDSQGTKNCQCKIADDNDPSTPQCFNNPDYGCQVEPHSSLSDPENGTPPSGSADYKLQAISAGTCYNGVAPCNKPFPTSSTLTGIIYVEGGLEINHDLTINGLLVTSGNLDVKAVLTVNKTGDEPSGIIVDPGNFYSKRTLNVTGVIWVAQSIYVNNGDINLTGGIIVHDIYINNSSTIIHYDPQVINETLKPTSQVIELKHWEEEY